MYKRLIIVSVIILTALCGLTWLGYHSIGIRAKGMEGTRLGEFAEVAEQIRQDVKRKLDEFIQTEQNRPYTDYQYYYVPENVASGKFGLDVDAPLLRSPLGGSIENNLAYGNFQIEPDGRIITPYYKIDQAIEDSGLSRKANIHLSNIMQNLLPALNGSAGVFKLPVRDSLVTYKDAESQRSLRDENYRTRSAKKSQSKSKSRRTKQYVIKSLEESSEKEQIVSQRRDVAVSNVAQNIKADSWQLDSAMQSEIPGSRMAGQEVDSIQIAKEESSIGNEFGFSQQASRQASQERKNSRQSYAKQQASGGMGMPGMAQAQSQAEQPQQSQVVLMDEEKEQDDMVQIRIEPFVPVVVSELDSKQSIFGGQVFMLRHVQIENRHFLQGFQLNEEKLLEEVNDSTQRFMREGMGFDLSRSQDPDAAFAAILDFGFGNLVLNLMEIDPAWIGRQIDKLRNWYFSIIGIVFLAVTLGLASLWRNARAQIKLAEKKDDFISAVSHELRTPLTSIRMYSEMLEKNWVKSEDKVTEYYRNMRQESERLSRLIENVLDFSRIQKGQKKYTFNLGDINKCIADVVEMMRPYAIQNGFSIETDFEPLAQTVFDNDAITQIVINLLDNAVKYARNAEDKTITIRTRNQEQFILIEVQDHGPGVPNRQRKKVFEQFYRTGSEATRETNGTGLGLALVKKFAEAHNGFVEILNAKPMGAVFRVGLAVQS